MNRSLILIGSGGHAKVLAEAYPKLKSKLVLIMNNGEEISDTIFSKIECTDDEKDIQKFDIDEVLLVNGIGSLPFSNTREVIYERFRKIGYEFATIISPEAKVSKQTKISQGVQIMKGAIIQPGVSIGENTIVNTGAIIDHDCQISSHNHIAPGATLSGGVITGKKVHIGTNATIIQSVEIMDECILGAGSILNKDLESGKIVKPASNLISEVSDR